MTKKISIKEFLEFNRVFSLLLLSRLSIDNSLALILKQTKNERFREILRKISSDIRAGLSLSKSCAKFPELFSEIYIANLSVAEETGDIATVLTEYTDYQEKFYKLRRKLLQAARYPLFTLIVAAGVVFFMLFFLLPTFGSMFSSMKTDLPPLTAYLLSVSEFAIANIHIIIMTLIALAVIMHFLSRSKSFKEGFTDPVMLKVPFFSSLFKQNLLARFSLSMSILLKSNVNLLESLRISKNISTNSLFRDEISRITKKLIKGESLANNIKRSEFFDITFNKLLAAGEESAELDKVFYLISEYYSREFDYRIDSITGMIEPVLILLIGAIVAVILIAMYLPMFEIINYLGV